jgi:hypothetical protein
MTTKRQRHGRDQKPGDGSRCPNCCNGLLGIIGKPDVQAPVVLVLSQRRLDQLCPRKLPNMWILSLWARDVCVLLGNREGDYPRSDLTIIRLKQKDNPVTASAFIKRKPPACLPTLALAPSLDAHAHETCTRLDSKVVTVPAVGHLRGRLPSEGEPTDSVVLTCVSKHLGSASQGNSGHRLRNLAYPIA